MKQHRRLYVPPQPLSTLVSTPMRGTNHRHASTASSLSSLKRKALTTTSRGAASESAAPRGRIGVPHATAARPSLECSICCELLLLPVKTSCSHIFCFFCLVHDGILVCPLCRKNISIAAGDFTRDTFSELCVKIYGNHNVFERRVNDMYHSRLRALLPKTSGEGMSVTDKHQRLWELADQITLDVEHAVGCRVPAEASRNEIASGVACAEEISARKQWVSKARLQTLDTSAQSEMVFISGYMRRRAPSLVVVHNDVDEGEISGQRVQPAREEQTNRSSSSTLAAAASATSDWRAMIRSRCERLQPRPQQDTVSALLPIVVPLDDHMEEFQCLGIVTDDAQDDDAVSAAAYNQLEELVQQPAVRRSSRVTLAIAPIQRTRLMSADTRLQAELRDLVKRTSVEVVTGAQRRNSGRR